MALARRVAAKLDIPFYVVDAKELFYSTVVQSFLDGYAQGVTPNPCVICNRQIKWDFLLNHALRSELIIWPPGIMRRKQATEDGQWQLLRSTDRSKDQSYVLHVLTQEKLSKALFPVGEYSKPEIRKLAGTFDLPTATRSDSQDLCFLAGEDYREFLRRNAPEIGRPGPILDRGMGKPWASTRGWHITRSASARDWELHPQSHSMCWRKMLLRIRSSSAARRSWDPTN